MEFVVRPTSRYQRFLTRIPILGDVLKQPLGALGFLIVLGFILVVIFAPFLALMSSKDMPISIILPIATSPLRFLRTHLSRT